MILQNQGIALPPDSPLAAEFRQMLARAYTEAAARSAQHDQGNFGGRPADPLMANPPPVPEPAPERKSKPKALLDIFERFAVEQKSQNANTLNITRKIIMKFDEFIGPNAPVTALTAQNVRNWKHLLRD